MTDPKSVLRSLLARDTWPHAVLLLGLDSQLKDEVLWWFVGQVVKSDAPKMHSDVLLVRQEEETTDAGRKRALSVEPIREVIDRLSLASYSGVKVAVIENADTMTVAAQNALLKTLEEPSGQALIVLSAQHADVLLPTLLSRVMTVTIASAYTSPVLADEISIDRFLHSSLPERFALIQKVVKHDDGVAFVAVWLLALIASVREELPKRADMLDAALCAHQKLAENGNPALLLETIAFCA
jgi:hypothetical protein